MKWAVLSMDVEDWYHLAYFEGMECRRDRSLLDGVEVYRDILRRHSVPSSFFVLAELAREHSRLLADLAAEGHEIAAHGWDHTRPLTMTPAAFGDALVRARATLEDVLGSAIEGYRAPCFSLDRQRLDEVRATGFAYDSSSMPFADHPLYGSIDLAGFDTVSPRVFRDREFFEFQLGTLPLAGRQIPVSGGAYLRIFPWALTGRLIKTYLASGELYTLYIHPFELSTRPTPPLPPRLSASRRLRFGLGRGSVAAKISKLITLLQRSGYEFTTFSALRRRLLRSARGASQTPRPSS